MCDNTQNKKLSVVEFIVFTFDYNNYFLSTVPSFTRSLIILFS